MPYDGAAIPEHNPVGDLPRGRSIINENSPYKHLLVPPRHHIIMGADGLTRTVDLPRQNPPIQGPINLHNWYAPRGVASTVTYRSVLGAIVSEMATELLRPLARQGGRLVGDQLYRLAYAIDQHFGTLKPGQLTPEEQQLRADAQMAMGKDRIGYYNGAAKLFFVGPTNGQEQAEAIRRLRRCCQEW